MSFSPGRTTDRQTPFAPIAPHASENAENADTLRPVCLKTLRLDSDNKAVGARFETVTDDLECGVPALMDYTVNHWEHVVSKDI